MNFLPVFLLYLEVFLLAFAEKRLWKTWFTPLNCLSVPYALVLTICLCINGKMGFVPFYYPSVWVWVVGLAVFFVPSCILGLWKAKKAVDTGHTEKTEGQTVSPFILRVLEYVTWGIFALFAFRFFYLLYGKDLVPGGEIFALDWAGHGFFGHLFTLLMGLNILWIFAADKNHKRFWLYVFSFFVVALLFLVKCWFLIPMAAGLLLRLVTGKTKFGFKVAFISVFVGFAFFFASYWMVLYVAASEKGVTEQRKKQPEFQAEVSSFIGKHAVTYLAAGVYGLSEDMAQNTLEYRDAAPIYAPFINICKLFGDKDYISNINDQYIQITRYDSGSNVRTFLGSLYVYLGSGHAVGYVLVFSCLVYLLFSFVLRCRHAFLLTVLGWVQGCLLMGWFDFYPSSLTFLSIPCFLLGLYGACFLWENRHRIPPFKRFYLRWPRRILALLQTISLALLVSLFWLPLNIPSYFLGVSVGIAFAFVLTVPRRALVFSFLKPYLPLLLLYLLLWVSISYSAYPDEAVKFCLRSISVLFFPFIFWGMTPRFFSSKRLNMFAACFVAGFVLLLIAKTVQLVYCFNILWPFFKVYYVEAGITYRSTGSGFLYALNEFMSNQAIYLSWANLRPVMHTTVEALCFNLAFAMVFTARVRKHSWLASRFKKCLADLILLLFALALITSNSKTGQFLFAVSLMMLVVLALRYRRWRIAGSILIVLIVVGSVGLHYFGMGVLGRFNHSLMVFEKVKDNAGKIESDGSLLPRIYCWYTAFEMIGEKPVLGFGSGIKNDYTQRFTNKYPDYQRSYWHPHNQFLFIFIATGIIGLLVFLWFWVQAVRLVWKIGWLWAWIWLLALFVFCCIDILFVGVPLFYAYLPYCFLAVSYYNRQKACGTSRDIRNLAN